MYAAVDALLERLSPKLENPSIKRLRRNEPHGGKVILPAGFEHLAKVKRDYYLWPCLVGRFQRRNFSLEFIPYGSNGRCLAAAEFRLPMPFDFVLTTRLPQRDFSSFGDMGLDRSRFTLPSESGWQGRWYGLSYEPDRASEFLAKEENRLLIEALAPFERLSCSVRFLRLTVAISEPRHLDGEVWERLLERLASLVSILEAGEVG